MGEDGDFYKHAIIKPSERWEKIINQNRQYIIEIKIFSFIKKKRVLLVYKKSHKHPIPEGCNQDNEKNYKNIYT